MKIPGQQIKVDIDSGVEPLWYSFFKVFDLFGQRGGYSEGQYVPVLTAS